MITSTQNGYLSYLLVDMVREGKINEAKKTKDTLVELFNELNDVTEQCSEPRYNYSGPLTATEAVKQEGIGREGVVAGYQD